jgi:hypothetical protein
MQPTVREYIWLVTAYMTSHLPLCISGMCLSCRQTAACVQRPDYHCIWGVPSAMARRYMEPVGPQPRRTRWMEQLHRSRQGGHTQGPLASTSRMFSPYLMNRQSPQKTPCVPQQLQCQATVGAEPAISQDHTLSRQRTDAMAVHFLVRRDLPSAPHTAGQHIRQI